MTSAAGPDAGPDRPPADTRGGEQPVAQGLALRCSFCGRLRRDVVTGETRGLCICGDCARLVLDILAEERAAPPA